MGIKLPGLVFCLTLSLVAGCSDTAYYGQAIQGHLSLMADRRPVDSVIAAADTPQHIRHKLELSQDALVFAHTQLDLPDNGSYRSYVPLQRDYVVWNVFAAPALSLKPRRWCFPVAGCVPYRGYFDQTDAQQYADQLRGDGDDAFVGGVTAYSTLGWFSDPLLSSFLNGSDWYTASLLFHELAHQRLYVADDSRFNEALAVAIEREATRRWLIHRGDQAALDEAHDYWEKRDQRIRRIAAARQRLRSVYDSELPNETKHQRKGAIFTRLNHALNRPEGNALNNATLAALQTYTELLPGFTKLLKKHGNDLPAFYVAVASLSELPKPERHQALTTDNYPTTTTYNPFRSGD